MAARACIFDLTPAAESGRGHQAFDLVILGSGSTAFAAALRARDLGKTTVMIDHAGRRDRWLSVAFDTTTAVHVRARGPAAIELRVTGMDSSACTEALADRL